MKLNFSDLDISKLQTIKQYLYEFKSISSYYTIGGLYFFSNLFKVKYAIFHSILLITIIKDNKVFFLPPITKEKINIYNCSHLPDDVSFTGFKIKEDLEDEYIYNISDLLSLKGKKYQKIRNHIHQYEKNIEVTELIKINYDNLNDCLLVLDDRLKQKYNEDDLHVKTLFKNIMLFPFIGYIMYFNNHPICFTFLEIKDNVLHVHIEKVNKSLKGAGDYFRINVLKKTSELYPNLKYINRQENLNNNGLKQQKESLRPTFYLSHYQVKGKK